MMSLTKPLKLSAFALGLSILACAAAAQEEDVDAENVFGDWRLRCERVGAEGAEQCALTQSVEAEDRDGVWLDAFVYRAEPGGQTLRISVVVPLGVILTRGLRVRVGEDVDLRFAFVTCSVDGCLALTDLAGELLDALRAEDEALLIYYFEEEQGIGVPISLDGFTAGAEALP